MAFVPEKIETDCANRKINDDSLVDDSKSPRCRAEACAYLQELAEKPPSEYRQRANGVFGDLDAENNDALTFNNLVGKLSIIDGSMNNNDTDLMESSVNSKAIATVQSDGWSVPQFTIVEPVQSPFSKADIASVGANGVEQKGHGDCVFESSVAAIANTQRGQGLIASMITQGQSGDYIVKFPGEATSVSVTPADLSDSKINAQESAWAKILEAAFVKDHPDLAEAKKPAEETRTLGQYDMNILTGATPSKIEASDKNSAAKISKALNNDQPVVAFCKDNDGGALVSGHEWTVTSYDSKNHDIVVRNPWGNFRGAQKDGIKDLDNGAVRMPFSAFQKFFGEVTSPGLS
jgi:hypothetical protein